MTEAIRKILDAAEQAHRENRLLDVKRGCVEAISLLRQEGAGADLANVTRRLAETERKLGESDAAIQRYEEAVALYREEDQPLRLAHTIRHLGDVLYEAGQADLAEPHFQEALAIYRAAQPQPSAGDLANAIRSMAVLKDEADEIEQAIALWSEARSLYATLNYPPANAETSARLALLAHRQGDRERAREYLGEAKAAAARCDDVGTLDFTRKADALIEG